MPARIGPLLGCRAADICNRTKFLGLFLGVDHRADHAIGAGVQHLADDAGLIPGHPHHRRHRMRLHRLETVHHGLVVLHAVLHVDGDAVEAALRDDLGGKTRRDRQPGVDHGLAIDRMFYITLKAFYSR